MAIRVKKTNIFRWEAVRHNSNCKVAVRNKYFNNLIIFRWV